MAHLTYIGTHLSYTNVAAYWDATTSILASVPGTPGTPTKVYFNGGSSLPAGDYVIQYLAGAWQITNDPANYPYNTYWVIGATRFSYSGTDIAVYFEHSGGTKVYAPGTQDTMFASQAACESANEGSQVSFTHSGGTICVYIQDYYWPDNVAGTPNPKYRLMQLGANHLMYTT